MEGLLSNQVRLFQVVAVQEGVFQIVYVLLKGKIDQ